MKNWVLFGLLIVVGMFFSGCKEQKAEEQPEIAPICPEGFYWIESSKTCVLAEDAFVYEDS